MNCRQSYRVIATEESYTSKASFLDNDELPKYGEKPEQWEAGEARVVSYCNFRLYQCRL
jgi:hypothetical protein